MRSDRGLLLQHAFNGLDELQVASGTGFELVKAGSVGEFDLEMVGFGGFGSAVVGVGGVGSTV